MSQLVSIEVNRKAYDIITKEFCGEIFHRREHYDDGTIKYFVKPALYYQLPFIKKIVEATSKK